MANTLKFGNGNWATKEDSVLAYNDENNNFKPLPFDFTRASTATYVDSDGLIKTARNGEARIDYTDSTDGALLLEPARTNSLTQSNKFDTVWVRNNITVTSSQTGVGGNSEAWKITASSGSGEKKLNINLNVSGNHAVSVYAKKGTRDYLYIRGVVAGLNVRTFFNLSTGTIGYSDSTSSNIIDMGNGWYRCEMVVNQQSGYEFFIGIAEYDNTPGYTDDGTGTIYVQYAQAEAGSYATSYIPTSGSSVTRVAETCNNSGNSEVFNDSEGVLFADIAALSNDLTYRQISIKEEVGAGDILTIDLSSANNGVRSYLRVNGSAVSLNATLGNETLYNKIAVKYGNTHSLWINGFEVKSQTLTLLPISLDKVRFDNGVGASKFFGKTKEIAYYNTALTDLELEELTSYRSWVSMVNELNLNIIYNG